MNDEDFDRIVHHARFCEHYQRLSINPLGDGDLRMYLYHQRELSGLRRRLVESRPVAPVAESVDALVSNTSPAGGAGSIPARGTT
jgi:hypothetical protein